MLCYVFHHNLEGKKLDLPIKLRPDSQHSLVEAMLSSIIITIMQVFVFQSEGIYTERDQAHNYWLTGLSGNGET